MRALLLALSWFASIAGLRAAVPQLLLASNLDAPFCYETGATRRWPILAAPLLEDVTCSLAASRDGNELARGPRLEFSGITVSLSRDGWLEIQSPTNSAPPAFDLEIKIEGGVAE